MCCYGRSAADTVMGRSAADTAMGRSAADTVMGRSAADTAMRRSAADTVVGGSAAGGPQVVQHSCMGTAVLHDLCGSVAVAKLQLPSSQPLQA